MTTPTFIWDDLVVDQALTAGQMDILWSEGWRHFGRRFFRCSVMVYEGEIGDVVPLRIPIAQFVPSKSMRRVLRRNADVTVRVVPAEITPELEAMFHAHKARFKDSVPETLTDFLSPAPMTATDPCECVMFLCELEGRCVAASYLDVGETGVSSVYAMFDPEFAGRGLGIFTMLKELEWARMNGKVWAYPGYATQQSSVYDYKKRFQPLEGFDWEAKDWGRYGKLVI